MFAASDWARSVTGAIVNTAVRAQRPNGSLGASVFAGWNAVNNQLIATYPNPCGT